jgi:hypothetical membrane protein
MDKLKIAGAVGFAAPIFTFICIFAAIATWPQFNWANNALSDLGVHSGVTAPVFNIGLVVGSIFFIVFSLGLFSFSLRAVGRVASLLFLVANFALMAIGIFNENYSPTHFIVSVALFVFLPISLLVFVVDFWFEGKRKLSVLTLFIALVAAAVWVLEFTINYAPGVAIPESISGICGALWVWVISYLMLKKQKMQVE